jgi:hypothetical protein
MPVWEPQCPDVGFHSRRVLNISSIGARITPPGSGCYSATKAAEALATVAESAEPPSLLVLGKDAFDAFDWVAQAERADLDRWRDLSLSTGIEG